MGLGRVARYRHPRDVNVDGRRAVWAFQMSLPLLLFWVLRSDPLIDQSRREPDFHFFVVSGAAILGLIVAAIIAHSARDHRDARVFLVALGLFSVAGIFLMHSLSTENRLLSQGQAGFIWSPPLSLSVGAIFFLLSSFRLSDRLNDWIVVNQRRLLVAHLSVIAGYAALLILNPSLLIDGLGLTSTKAGGYAITGEGGMADTLLVVLTILAVACYLVAGFRYYLEYRRRPSVLLIALIAGVLLFAEANTIMSFSDAWRLSWWLYHLVMALAFIMIGYGLLVQFSKRGSIHGMFEDIFLREQLERLDNEYSSVIVALINSLEAKDKYTKGHSARVAMYSEMLAREMGCSQADIHRIEQAALLHDLGKLAMPDAILNKAGKLTPEEFEIVRNHPVRGCAIIEAVDTLQDKIPGILHHHEWVNGMGYPMRLTGDDIPLDARIIAVADVFDAITSLRAYHRPFGRQEALDHLRQEAGTHLDAECVGRFIAGLQRHPIQIGDYAPQLPVEELVARYQAAGY
ncbi:MAG TPA: HD domain-containing phosphohydrolase [Chloroflexota bacterium]|nr:HD domain-containing phosphohydrolase [Chloroflexota bacterium]